MEHTEILKRIDELEREIALLPRGSVAVKRINDKEYYYHRINENGKRRETYVDFDQVEELRAQIEKRKALEKELKELRDGITRMRSELTAIYKAAENGAAMCEEMEMKEEELQAAIMTDSNRCTELSNLLNVLQKKC